MTKIKDIIHSLDNYAPRSLQEKYDNSGLLVGDANVLVKGVLVSLDTTEDVVDEAIKKGANLIVSHHPIIFSGLKKLNGNNYIERVVIKAIKNDIAIYAIHTNLDNVIEGVNGKIAEKLGLSNCSVLSQKEGELLKLAVFVPKNHVDKVRNALFESGAGHVGNYSECSFSTKGIGSFKANPTAKPFVGRHGEVHFEKEKKIEVIVPRFAKGSVISALLNTHPYEEVAYDLYPILNRTASIGSGMIGELDKEMDEVSFMKFIKKSLETSCIRHTELLNKNIKKVALCGGSGDFLLEHAINKNADVFISGDFKYHRFFDADKKLVIMDIGHFESEQFTIELLVDFLKENFSTFAIRFTEVKTNPINYF